MNEWEWVEWIAAQVGPPPRSLRWTWQEDATVWREGGRWWVFSVDQFIEDVHFRRTWCTMDAAGAKAVLRAVSDVWVQGARPRYLWVALQVPPDADPEAMRALYRGILQVCRAMGAYLAGGDTARGARWSLGISVLGSTRTPLRRQGARPGGSLWLTGPVGWSGLGVALLERWHAQGRPTPLADHLPAILEADGWPASLHAAVRQAVRAALRPDLPLPWREWTTRHAWAAIDVSDGFLLDLWRLLRVNGVGAEIDGAALDPGEDFRTVCRHIGCDPLDLALQGGEDYAWIVVLPPEAPDPPFPDARRVGRLVPDSPGTIFLRTPDGRLIPTAPAGWDHLGSWDPEAVSRDGVWVVEADGASLGNPGPAGYGFVIRDPAGVVRHTESGFVGTTTNNVAEYTAIVRALQWLRGIGADRVEVRTDSLLTVRQLQGIYRVRSRRLTGLYEEARRLLAEFRTWRVVHVPREQNRQADALARRGARQGA